MKRRVYINESVFVYVAGKRPQHMTDFQYFEVTDSLHRLLGAVVKLSERNPWEARVIGEPKRVARNFRTALRLVAEQLLCPKKS